MTACRVARIEALVVVLRQDENGHQITPASFLSLPKSSSMPSTSHPYPACRFGGSSNLRVDEARRATSTPSSSGVSVSIGFFFAFMMLGSDA